MIAARPHIVIIVLAEGPAAGADVEVLAQLGFDGSPNPRWRRLDRRLLVTWPERVTTEAVEAMRSHDSVAEVLHLTDDDRLVASWPFDDPATVDLGHGVRCGDEPIVIAGPCSLETADQLMATAELVAETGAHALRCGLYKPRTSPYSFGGVGEQGLPLLAEARRRTGLPVASEVLDEIGLRTAAEHLDVVQIGSRNMYNHGLLFQAGAHPAGRPVLLKRGFGATLDELLHAAEYVLLGRLAAGHRQAHLMLCERGIRTFERTTRFTLDLASVAALRQRTALPVIVDPSHAAGDRRFVPPLARAALAAGADGLLVEVHPEPACAWCDGDQGLDPASFRRLMDDSRDELRRRPSCRRPGSSPTRG